jgi:hypothetical protein
VDPSVALDQAALRSLCPVVDTDALAAELAHHFPSDAPRNRERERGAGTILAALAALRGIYKGGGQGGRALGKATDTAVANAKRLEV